MEQPTLRLADMIKRFKPRESNPELSNLILVARSGRLLSRTSHPFDIRPDGTISVNNGSNSSVRFSVEEPPTLGDHLKLTIVKTHSVERDVLVGEAIIEDAVGPLRAKLFRNGQLVGRLVLNVTEILPSQNMKHQFSLTSNSSSSTKPSKSSTSSRLSRSTLESHGVFSHLGFFGDQPKIRHVRSA